MAKDEDNTSFSSTQYRTLLEIVDDFLARYKALEILREKYLQVQREREPDTYRTTELTRRDALRILRTAYFDVRGRGPSGRGRTSIEPPDEMERRLR